jgi:transcriptional regulator with XRE-family HTH domain
MGVERAPHDLRPREMKADVKKRLGRRVLALRLARGYTQEQLAERCAFSGKFISAIERGRVNVPLLTLADVARGLGVTTSELTLAIDGAPPREVTSFEQLLAGRGRKEQIGIARVFTGMLTLLDSIKSDGSES